MTLVLSLHPSVRLVGDGQGDFTLDLGDRELRLAGLSPALRGAVRALRGEGSRVSDIEDEVLGREGRASLSLWYHHLGLLERIAAVRYSAVVGTRVAARLTVTSPHFAGDLEPLDSDEGCTLSRFALLRRVGSGLVLESPLSMARVELLDAVAVEVLTALGSGATARQVETRTSVCELAEVQAFLGMLHGAGLLTTVDGDGGTAEEHDPTLEHWEFADALFHARSRRGRHANPMGRTFPHRGRFEPAPLVKAPMSPETIELARAEVGGTRATASTFAQVLEARRSLRAHGASPITIDELGRFLFRAARIQELIPEDPEVRPFVASLRPYPAGGACHALEVYLAVRSCGGLDAGIYHYDPAGHRLEALSVGTEHVSRLLADCPTPSDPTASWQILVVVAARFRRLSWKYQGVSYATLLKDLGGFLQTMYLVATSMDLAPCALGGGDAELFARMIGSDYFEETSVGEFLLGSRPTS